MSVPPVSPVVILIGGGGHGRVVLDALQQMPAITLHGILDADPALHGTTLYGVPILGDDALLPALWAQGRVSHFVIGVGGTGSNRPRQRLYEAALRVGVAPLIVQHPAAILSPHSHIGPGAQVLARVVVNAGAQVGEHALLNTGCIVEHDAHIGAHAHIAPGAVLSGGVRVGQGAHIGAGATVRQSITIGDYAVVGAGAVVIRDVPDGVVVVGNPAHPLEKNREHPHHP